MIFIIGLFAEPGRKKQASQMMSDGNTPGPPKLAFLKEPGNGEEGAVVETGACA